MSSAAFWAHSPPGLYGFGYHDPDTLFLILYHSAIGFSVVNLLVHDARLIHIGLSLMFVPPLIAQFLFAKEQVWVQYSG